MHCVVLLLLFFGQFFHLFVCLFPIGIFPTKNRNRTRFPPAAPGRSSEASDTSHTSLSRRPCGCPGPADSSRSYSTYVPRGDRILNTHTQTHTHSYTYAYEYYNADTQVHKKCYMYPALFRHRRRAQFPSNSPLCKQREVDPAADHGLCFPKPRPSCIYGVIRIT